MDTSNIMYDYGGRYFYLLFNGNEMLVSPLKGSKLFEQLGVNETDYWKKKGR